MLPCSEHIDVQVSVCGIGFHVQKELNAVNIFVISVNISRNVSHDTWHHSFDPPLELHIT
jgi:hypothetical protein